MRTSIILLSLIPVLSWAQDPGFQERGHMGSDQQIGWPMVPNSGPLNPIQVPSAKDALAEMEVKHLHANDLAPSFASITELTPFVMGSIDTQHKPQGKVWFFAGKWWCAIPVSGGTKIHRLDGTTWTAVRTVQTSGGRADCWVDGNVVHILNYRGAGVNQIGSFQYNSATNSYDPWSARPTNSTLTLPTGVEAATLTVDGTGRMWVAADGNTDVQVFWSDYPYSTWSAPIVVAAGISSDDICAITRLPGRVGVFWSNQSTGLFGFKTHQDGAAPGSWSADEVPASQSAIAGNARMADDHMNLVAASDGTLYCAVRTSYTSTGLPRLALLVRRPNGTWDDLYPVTTTDAGPAIVIVNEVQGKLKVVYTAVSGSTQIMYKESTTGTISFGAAQTLMAAASLVYNYASSTHQTYHPEVVILATDQTTSTRSLISVLASDEPPAGGSSIQAKSANKLNDLQLQEAMPETSILGKGMQANIYPNPVQDAVIVKFTAPVSGKYTIVMYDTKGFGQATLASGWTTANREHIVRLDVSGVADGLYLIKIQAGRLYKTLKLVKAH